MESIMAKQTTTRLTINTEKFITAWFNALKDDQDWSKFVDNCEEFIKADNPDYQVPYSVVKRITDGLNVDPWKLLVSERAYLKASNLRRDKYLGAKIEGSIPLPKGYKNRYGKASKNSVDVDMWAGKFAQLLTKQPYE
tara:strand:- start:142 stop:555 length:414 start_codon:yes stop_codon:yes gene_type:complete